MRKLNIQTSIFFAILVAIFLCLSIGHSPIASLNHQEYVIFVAGDDYMADFFNVQRYIVDRDPYFTTVNGSEEHIYLPLGYIFLLPFSRLCDYSNMSLQDCWNSHIAVFSALLFLLISLFFLFDSLFRLNSKKGWRTFNTFLFLFTSIFLFTIERGTLVILAVACVNYFLAFYDSESVWLRRLGLLCLCIAAVLKIYPVVFGVLLLADKRYKDIMFCIGCGLILTFVPFMFFKHGLSNVPKLFENVQLHAEMYGARMTRYKFGIPVLSYLFAHGIRLSEHAIEIVIACAKTVSGIMAIASLVLAIFAEKRWLKVGLLAMIPMLYPANAGFYCGMYLLPFIVVCLNREDNVKWTDYAIAILLCLIMNPIQVFSHNINLSPIFANMCSIALWMMLIILAGVEIFKNMKSI